MDDEGPARNPATDGESAPADPAKRTQAAVGANNFASRGEVAGQERKPHISSAKKKKGPPLDASGIRTAGGLFDDAAGDATGDNVDALSLRTGRWSLTREDEPEAAPPGAATERDETKAMDTTDAVVQSEAEAPAKTCSISLADDANVAEAVRVAVAKATADADARKTQLVGDMSPQRALAWLLQSPGAPDASQLGGACRILATIEDTATDLFEAKSLMDLSRNYKVKQLKGSVKQTKGCADMRKILAAAIQDLPTQRTLLLAAARLDALENCERAARALLPEDDERRVRSVLESAKLLWKQDSALQSCSRRENTLGRVDKLVVDCRDAGVPFSKVSKSSMPAIIDALRTRLDRAPPEVRIEPLLAGFGAANVPRDATESNAILRRVETLAATEQFKHTIERRTPTLYEVADEELDVMKADHASLFATPSEYASPKFPVPYDPRMKGIKEPYPEHAVDGGAFIVMGSEELAPADPLEDVVEAIEKGKARNPGSYIP